MSGAGAAEFPLTAQTNFCDSRSPLRHLPLPLPLQPTFFTPAHRSAPAHQIFGPLRSSSAPAPVYFKQQTEKWRDSYRASRYASAVLCGNSVCLFVRLIVCLSATRVLCGKTKQCTTDILIPHERAIILVF